MRTCEKLAGELAHV